MWNIKSPPFKYSITKNRCDCPPQKTQTEPAKQVDLIIANLIWFPIHAIYVPLFGKCRTDGRDKDVSCQVPAPCARSWYTRHRHPRAPRLSSDIWWRNKKRCLSAPPASPTEIVHALTDSGTLEKDDFVYLAKTALAEDFDQLEIVVAVLAEFRFRLDGRFATSWNRR